MSTPQEAVPVHVKDLAKSPEPAEKANGDSFTQDHAAMSGSTTLPTDQAPPKPRGERPEPTTVVASTADRPGGSVWAAILPWKRAKAEKAPIPRFSKSMIQGELSLEAVKVVRNDLSDSDLEIVPAKPTIIASPKPMEAPPPRAVPAENNWNRLAGRMFGAGKT